MEAILDARTSAPRISVLLLAYRQSATVREAALSVLTQQCEPLEVLLSDDGSDDDTAGALEAVAAQYHGPHTVRVLRVPINQGIAAHYNRLVEQARGRLLVTAAGDDRSLPGRIAAIAEAWDASGETLDLIAAPLVELLPDGRLGARIEVDRLQDWRRLDQWIGRRPRVIGAAHAFTRRLYERFGPMHPDVAYEDQVHLLRALLGGGALTLDEPGVAYRTGGLSTAGPAADGAAYLDWVRRQNRRHLAGLEQWMTDARQADAGDAVARALDPEWRRQRFLQAALSMQPPPVSVLWQHPGIPWAWKLGKWLGLRHPARAAARRRRDAAP